MWRERGREDMRQCVSSRNHMKLLTFVKKGHDDSVRVNVWLPLEEKEWNGNFFGQGGGGYVSLLLLLSLCLFYS